MGRMYVVGLLIALFLAGVVFLYVFDKTDSPDYTFHGIYIYGSLNLSLGKHVYVMYDGDPGLSELNAEIAKNVPNLVYSLSKKGYNVSTEALVYADGKYLSCVGYENFTLNECLNLVNSSSVIWIRYPTNETHVRVYLKNNDIIVYPRNRDDYYNITLFLNELILGHFST